MIGMFVFYSNPCFPVDLVIVEWHDLILLKYMLSLLHILVLLACQYILIKTRKQLLLKYRPFQNAPQEGAVFQQMPSSQKANTWNTL